jgi:ATP-dependent helicase/nuclease subunit A
MSSSSANQRLTEEQHLAVFTRDVSVLLSSGAGCGKTHVLTERYLAHLREGAEVGQIVAITFTERAARQMRGRIRQAVIHHLRTAEEDEAEAWARHLRNLETAPISTIHSFCGTLLRQNAVEAGLDPQFDVLEEVLSINLSNEAISSALQRLLTAQTEVGDDLRELVLLFGWRAVNDLIPVLVESHDASAWARWLDTPPKELAERWQKFAAEELRVRYLEYILAARPKIAVIPPLLKQYPPEPGPLVENVHILLEELPQLPASTDLAASVERLAEAAKVARGGAKAWPEEDVYERIKNAFSAFRDDIRKLKLDCFTLDPHKLLPAIEVGKRLMRVAADAWRTYRERKQYHGVVDFQDLLVLARDLVRDYPEVRSRLQDRYRVLLIDELQDTDPVQMELVELLCGDELTAGKLFAVGDHSQSVYRFRKADVALFHALRTRMPQKGQQGLTLNFRSQPAILDFTNALLGHRLIAYEPLRPHQPQVNPGSCVEFLWSACKENDSAVEARQSEAEGIARRIVAMIDHEKLVVEKTTKGRQLRPVRRGDIVLLFRAMSNVHIYETALRKYGLDYYLVGGRAFFAQQEVYDLLNLLRALENPQDEVSLAGTLRSPFCCISDEAIFVLRIAPAAPAADAARNANPSVSRQGLWKGLHDDASVKRLPPDQRPRVLRARKILDCWRTLKDQVPISRLLNQVFSDSGYDAAMQFEFLGDRKLANLWKLVDLARTFDRSGLFGLAEFIARLGDLVESQPREEQAATQPEHADVIRLMTIHQAKGLEFPVVIIPDMDAAPGSAFVAGACWDTRLGCLVRPPSDEDPPPFEDHGWTLWRMREEIEDWHESLRTLYVACTRAEDYLILSASMTNSLQASSPWMQTLAGRFDLRSGKCLVEGGAVRVIGSAVGLDVDALPLVPSDSGPAEVEKGWPEAIPVRGAGQVVFSVEELEGYLRGETKEAWKLGAFAAQHDAEDGSDIHHWPTRTVRPTLRERVLRGVLQSVDMSDPQHWQPRLRLTAAQMGLPFEEVGALEESLERFTQNLGGWMWQQDVCWFEREFLLEWPRKRPPQGLQRRPVVRGTIDMLWKKGRYWGLLWLIDEPLPSGELTDLHPGVIFWVLAAREWFGGWPQSVEMYSLVDQSRRVARHNWQKSDLVSRFNDALVQREPEAK